MSCAILASVLSVFAVIFVVPMVQEWPYQMDFTFSHVWDVFRDSSLVAVYKNSILVAALTALTGSLIAVSYTHLDVYKRQCSSSLLKYL